MGSLSDGQGEVHAEPALTKSPVLSDTPAEQTRPLDPPQVGAANFCHLNVNTMNTSELN